MITRLWFSVFVEGKPIYWARNAADDITLYVDQRDDKYRARIPLRGESIDLSWREALLLPSLEEAKVALEIFWEGFEAFL
jgi:hypothetical protein